MIIQIIDIYRVPALEPKYYPPIARNRDRIMTFQTAFELVQSKAGQVHSLKPAGSVQCGQDTRQFCDVAQRDFRRASAFIKRYSSRDDGTI